MIVRLNRPGMRDGEAERDAGCCIAVVLAFAVFHF